MDSKKRARTEDVDPPSSKKRALSIPHDSPVLNGAAHDNDEPKDEANLEVSPLLLLIATDRLKVFVRCLERMPYIGG